MSYEIPSVLPESYMGEARFGSLNVLVLRVSRIAQTMLQASRAQIVAADDTGGWIAHEGDIPAPVPAGEDMIWVADALKDAAWRDHPLFQGKEGLRFFAAAPIRLDAGTTLGALQIFDIRPHPHDSRLAAGLIDLAGLVSDEYDRLLSSSLALENLQANQTQLRDMHDKTQAILDHSLDVICAIDADGRFIQVSRHAVDVWGYTAEELIGRVYIDMVHPDDKAATEQVAAGIMQGRPVVAFRNRYISKDGSVVPTSWSANWSSAHDCMFCVARDLSDWMAMDERLRQAEKLEAVGRLTGGVAHDFNNLLTIVIGASEALVAELETTPDSLALAQLTHEAGKRGAELVKQLLTFSRDQPMLPRSLDTGALLRSLEPLLRLTIGSDVQLRIEPHAQPLYCVADAVQLESAIMNLCINARDASRSGDMLVVATSPLTVEGAGGGDLKEGAYVVFSVTDTGEGMSPEIQRRARDPFFTTKAVGKGTGLGLSTVYGFTEQSGGRLRIRSHPGQGTTVQIILPQADAPEQDSPVAKDKASANGADHILVVDDDPMVRQFAARQLVGLGYRVTSVADGRQALEILLNTSDVDLLFTDMIGPGGMGGRELALRAGRIAPHIPVLFTSGSPEELSTNFEAADPVEILRKPYSRADLVRRIEMVLVRPSIGKW